ncbi:hypothetical protein BGZ63DRAFT_426669 [Mariannaea sp. PMI_226]|nr:hypothetical protein BGZ63DRAFT_426669 [Mariannaea sp. PMI_226]
MSDFKEVTLQAGEKLSKQIELLKSIALKLPNDHNAQLRAQAAVTFYDRISGFPERTDNHVAEQFPSSSINLKNQDRSGLSSRLPIEILELIINHVEDFDHGTKQKTMIALSASSRMLRTIAEQRLYAHSHNLKSIENQWKFLFALTIDPYLGNLVDSLKVQWLPTGENGKLLIDIANVCISNKVLSIERGKDRDCNMIWKEDVLNLAAIFGASPNVTRFNYYAYVRWFPPMESHEHITVDQILDLCKNDSRFMQFASQLTHLFLYYQSEWVLHALSPHLSPNLTSFSFAGDGTINFESKLNPFFFTELARQCPYLEKLYLDCRFHDPRNTSDLLNACKTWGHTLKDIYIEEMEHTRGWIPQLFTSLKAVTKLFLGGGCRIVSKDLDAVIKASPEQQLTDLRFEMYDVETMSDGSSDEDTDEEVDEDAAKIQFNNGLIGLIGVYSSTLECLNINSGSGTRVGRAVLHSCQQAHRLKELHLSPPADIEPSDVDELLHTCPDLSILSEDLQRCSLHFQEWEERAERS